MTSKQEDRYFRAIRQLSDYTFIKKPGRVLVRKGNTTYTVTKSFCTCPDFEQRCESAGELCKHQLMVENIGLLQEN